MHPTNNKNKAFVLSKHVFLSWQNDCGRMMKAYFAEWVMIISKKNRCKIAMRADAHIKRIGLVIACVGISIVKKEIETVKRIYFENL